MKFIVRRERNIAGVDVHRCNIPEPVEMGSFDSYLEAVDYRDSLLVSPSYSYTIGA